MYSHDDRRVVIECQPPSANDGFAPSAGSARPPVWGQGMRGHCCWVTGFGLINHQGSSRQHFMPGPLQATVGNQQSASARLALKAASNCE